MPQARALAALGLPTPSSAGAPALQALVKVSSAGGGGQQPEASKDPIGHVEAAAAVEWEHIGQGRGQFLIQGLPQQLACPVQSRLYGLGTEVQELRRLLNAHIFNSAHHEDNAEDLRQLVDGLFDQAANRVLGGLTFGVFVAWHGRKRNDLSSLALRRIEN